MTIAAPTTDTNQRRPDGKCMLSRCQHRNRADENTRWEQMNSGKLTSTQTEPRLEENNLWENRFIATLFHGELSPFQLIALQ